MVRGCEVAPEPGAPGSAYVRGLFRGASGTHPRLLTVLRGFESLPLSQFCLSAGSLWLAKRPPDKRESAGSTPAPQTKLGKARRIAV